MKLRKLIIIAIPVTMLASSMSLFAHTGTGSDKLNPMSWNQIDQNQIATFGHQNMDWRAASCMIQSCAFIQVKIGQKPIGYAPWDLKADLDKNNSYASTGFLSYNKVDFGSDWVVEKNSEEHGMIEATYQDLFKYYEQGYLVGIRVMSPAGPHFIVIDYIDENGEIHIFDSGFKGLKFSDTYSPGNVLDVVLLKSKSGKKAKDLPRVQANEYGEQLYAKIEDPTGPALTDKELVEKKKQDELARKQKVIDEAKRTKKLKEVEFAVANAENSGDKKQIAYAIRKISELDKKDQANYLERIEKLTGEMTV